MTSGSEVWDWAARLSAHNQRQAKIRQLTMDIARTGTRCGDCNNWMKSRECPREKNFNGLSRGPSCDAPICGQFSESSSATKRRADLSAELAAVQSEGRDQ